MIALHTAYVIAFYSEMLAPAALMWLALVAYAAYAINASQFLMKLRMARLQAAGMEAVQ